MLNLANEELEEEPFYYDLSEMCSVLHCVMPSHDQLRWVLIQGAIICVSRASLKILGF